MVVLVTSDEIALALGFQVTPILDTVILQPKNRTPPEGLSGVGKRPRDDCDGQSSFPHLVRLTSTNTVTAATARAQTIIICGNKQLEAMLDSGSFVSLLRQDCLNGMERTQTLPSLPMLQLVTAAGTLIPIVDYIEATVKIGNKQVRHKFIVVDSLITSAILGIDFMKKHRITLDFNTTPVGVFFTDPNLVSAVEIPSEVQQMLSAVQGEKSKAWTAAPL